jgi:predicted ATPase
MFSRKEVQFSDKNIEIETANHIKIELSALSSGEKQLLRIFIETLMAAESTILIDEPELSMHIDWQRSLVPSMSQLNPKAQIILATHSPEVMANLKEECIFRL